MTLTKMKYIMMMILVMVMMMEDIGTTMEKDNEHRFKGDYDENQ